MPTYKATLSDGRVVTMEADQQPSQDDILSAVDSYKPATQTAPDTKPDLGVLTPKSQAQIPSGFLPPIPRNNGMESTISGGPQLRQAGAPGAGAELGRQFMTGLKEAQSTSLLDDTLPTAEPDPGDSKVAAVGKEAYNLLTGIPKFATSGAGFETMPAAVAKPALTAAAFTVDMVKNLGSLVSSTYKDWDKMSGPQKAAAITDIAGTTAFAGLLGHGAVKGLKPKASNEEATVEEKPRVAGTGEQAAPATAPADVAGGVPPPEPQPAKAKTAAKAFRIEQDENGGYAITAPDGSVVSEHPTLQQAKLAVDDLAKPPAIQKAAADPIASLTTGKDFAQIQRPHAVGVEDGMKLTESDLPALKAEQQKANQELAQSVSKGDDAFKAAFGKMTYLGGVLEGAARKGPNYDALMAERKAAANQPLSNPEDQAHLDAETKDLGVQHELVNQADNGNPFAKRLEGKIATIDRKTGKVLINRGEFEDWLKNDVPPSQKRMAIRSLLSEEQNHLATDDSAANAYWRTLTPVEQKIIKGRYNGGDSTGMNDTLWGHEALSFQMHRMARMTPHQIITAARSEQWKLKSLAVLESSVRGIRKALGTKASKEGNAILDQVQKNIAIGRTVAAGSSTPAALSKKAKEAADKNADELESQAKMYVESGDAKSAEELQNMAKRLRSQSGEDFFPAARPKKRQESVFQDKFFLPGEETQKAAGTTAAVPYAGEAAPVKPEDRTSAEAAGALPRLSGAQLQQRANDWVQKSILQSATAIGEGKKAAIPTFKDFAEHMKGQQSELQPGQLHEMWSSTVANALDKASGEQLGALVKSIWGRQVTEAAATGRRGFFRGIISGAQKVPDVPEGGFKLEQDVPGRTEVERYQDTRKLAGLSRSRDKVVGALFNKLVKPVMEDTDFQARTTDPEDLRYGGGKTISAVHEFSPEDEKNPEVLGKELVDESRRSSEDPLTATKRLTAIMDRKSGTVDLVSTYRHPANGTMLVDPNSPQRTHSPLDSILRRYRVIGSVLRDSPVQNFKQHFGSLQEYNHKFANEARQRYQSETSYDPESITSEEFTREIGGRMQGTQEGHLMGPAKGLIASAGPSERERSSRTPMTAPEARSILDYIHEQQGTIDSADDVREAMLALKDDPNNQVISGLSKLARGMQEKNPDLSIDELLSKVAQRIYENHIQSESVEDFSKRTMAESRPTAGEDFEPEDASPAAVNRRKVDEERERIGGEVKVVAGRAMSAIGRAPTVDKMAYTLDAADTLANNEARNAEQSIRLETAGDSYKDFHGDKDILSAANAKLSAGGIKTRYHYSDEALDEADRLLKEDPEFIKDNEFANRKRDPKNQQLKLEGEVANQKLQQKVQKRLIETGFLNHSDATYYHDPKAVDKLDEFMMRVRNGMEAAQRLSKGNYWDRFRASRWMNGAEALQKELEFAKAHWNNDKLISTAIRMKKELDGQYDLETQNGYHLNYDPDYLPGRYDGELFSQHGVLFGGLRMLGKQFRSAKVFPSYYHAIEAGPYIAASRDGASIVSSRVRQGMRSLNRTMWWNSLKGFKDEPSGKPVAMNGKTVNGKLSSPSPEYTHQFRTPGGETVFVRDGYEHLVHQLTDPSAIQHWALTRAAMEAGQFLKHTVIVGDLFHLGRVAYYAVSHTGLNTNFIPGWAALDFRESDLPKAVESGKISEKTAAWLSQKIAFNVNGKLSTMNRMELSKEFQRSGLNVGQIQDALYKDLTANIPAFGRYNKFLFDRFTRGLMMNSALREFDRISKIDPNTDSRTLMRGISKDLNSYFGSIGRQGWIKSATFQDLSRLTFLAPQWLEGLVKKEVSPIRALTNPRRALTGRDTMFRGMARGLAAMVALTQVINLITRRQPTWQNQEPEHKWDADVGEGVWLSPLAVFNELTGDLVRLGETKPKAWDAIQQIGENKLGFYGRAAIVLATDKSPGGAYQTTTAGVLKSAAQELIPTPISFGTAGKALGHAIAPNLVGAVPPGKLLAQAYSSLGLKTHEGMDLETRMEHSAADFNKAHGRSDSAVIGYTDEPSLSQLRYLLKIGDTAGAQKMLAQLEQTKPIGKIIQSMNIWTRRTFTGSKKSEHLWVAGMSDSERSQYQQALQDRHNLLNQFENVLR